MSKHARKHENASVSLKQKQTKKLLSRFKKGWLVVVIVAVFAGVGSMGRL